MGQFKVVVVGAGPVGLVMALALQASGIDFVVLERRREVPPPTAFGIFLWPHILRIFHQLGLYEELKGIGQPMTTLENRSSSGEQIGVEAGYQLVEMAHGYPMTLFDRRSIAELMLKHIKNVDERVKTDKKVINITTHADGVIVDLADGTSEHGSIVVGADGVWSTVRDAVRERAPQGLLDGRPNPFSAPYQGLFFRLPRPESLAPGQTVLVHHGDSQLMALVTATEAHMTTYEPIPDVSERTYLVPNELPEEAVSSWYDVPVNESLTFKDLWESRVLGGKVNHDEGVIPWWHWDRLVLVGDAVHKMNPFRGAGACCGIEGVVTLVNKLNETLASNPNPSRRDLTTAFTAYQSEREPGARMWLQISRLDTDLYTSPSGPAVKASMFSDARALSLVADSPVLEMLQFSNEQKGMIPWKRHPRGHKESKETKARL